jgi:hypothetical protein
MLEWSQSDVLDTHGCIPKRQPFVMEIIGFPLKIDRHENRLYIQHLKLNYHQCSPSYGLSGAAAMQFF